MKMTHILKLLFIILAVAMLLLGAIMGCKIYLNKYFENSYAVTSIPGLSKGFIPQGIAYDSKNNCFFLTGYMGTGKISPIYVISNDGGKEKKRIQMRTESGEEFKGHAGGLSVYGNDLYIAGSTAACMYSFSIDELLKAKDGESVKAKQKIILKDTDDYIRVSFTSVDESLLYAGEFHKGPIFRTNKSHQVDHNGVTQKAYLFGFELSDDNQPVPKCVYSIPDDIQGACFYKGIIYLSQSKGFLPGRIITFSQEDLVEIGEQQVLGKSVPLYVLSKENAKKITTIPPMPEEIVAVDDHLHIVFEAASNRYRIGKIMGLNSVYATPLDYFN